MHLIHRWTLFLPPLGFESVGSPNMCKVDEAKRSHRQRQVLAVESRRHSGGVRCVSMAFASQQLAKKMLMNLFAPFPPSFSVCQAVPMEQYVCGHSASKGVSPPTGCTMKGCGPYRSTRHLHTSIPEAGTKRSTAPTCATLTSVFSSARKRRLC